MAVLERPVRDANDVSVEQKTGRSAKKIMKIFGNRFGAERTQGGGGGIIFSQGGAPLRQRCKKNSRQRSFYADGLTGGEISSLKGIP